MKNLFVLAMAFMLMPNFAQAQQKRTWSLEKCIKHAQDKSLLVKQSELAIESGEITLTQAKMSRYPTVNASTSLGLNSGRTVNFVDNSINTTTSIGNNIGINSSVVLYQGGRVKNTIKQSELDLKAARLDVEQTAQDIALQVAQAYLSVLLAEEQLTSVQSQLQQIQDQLVQTDKLIRGGVLPANNRLDIEAQVARGEQTVIAAQNAVSLGYLSLKQLMFLDPDTEIKVFAPEVEMDESTLNGISTKAIYSKALNSQPNIRAGELRAQSADIGEEIALAGKKPTLAASAGINTGYSSLAKTPFVESVQTQTTSQEFTIDLGGGPQTGTLDFEQDVPVIGQMNTPYFDQLNNNLGQNIGLSLSYPIWDNRSAKLQAERAKLNKENIEIQNEQLKQRLMIDIQNAYTNAIAAQKTYQAAERSLASQQASYQNTKKRYDLGSANAFELSTARNSLSLAEIEQIRSKFDYLFRLKILDFYSGKPIKL